MKKMSFLCLLFLGLSLQGFNQITLTDSDFASVGTSFEQRLDTVPAVIPGMAGASQTWDFSALHSHDTSMYTAVNPLSMPFGARFTNANIALNETGTPNTFFFNKSASGITTVGLTTDYMNTGDTVCLIFNDQDTMLTLPSTYNTSFITHVNGDTKSAIDYLLDTMSFQVQVDSVRIIHHAVKNSIIDAWGELTLPNGSLPALRQYTYETSIDSIYAYVNNPPVMTGWMYYQAFRDTATQFIWWAKNAGNAVVTMDYDSATATVKRVYWQYIQGLGMNPASMLNDFSVYPNPAQGQLHIQGQQGHNVILYNNLGQVVLSTIATGQAQLLDVSELPRGMYVLQQASDQGMKSTKIILQ